jgi:hypothetical protein
MSGARVAAYLRGEAEAGVPPEKILERLAAPQPAEPAPVRAFEPVQAVDQAKLAKLAKPAGTAPPTPKPKSDTDSRADLETANEKLAGLVGKRK